MQIFRSQNAKFTEAYDVLCASVVSTSKSRSALSPTVCKVLPGTKTAPHAHFEPELFFIVEGTGRITIDCETAEVQPGDIIQIPAYAQHTMTSTSSTDLIFLSVYSEDVDLPSLPIQALVTSAPPTPNGPLHLGHISGPYLAADMISRYLRSRSAQVLTHSGTDDHQNYVSERANALGLEPETFRLQMRKRIQSCLTAMQIDVDEFIEPKTSVSYQTQIQEFAKRAIERQVIVKKSVDLPHCASCEHALVDALISGTCPICKEESRGGCEACGTVVPPHQLLHPHCSRCGNAAQLISTEVYVFELSQYLSSICTELTKLHLPQNLQNLCAAVARAKNVEVIVSHPALEGIPLPGTDQTLHVWFEMAAHYEKFATSGNFWIHCFGFDNSFYYLLFIPALLKAMNPNAKLPNAVLTNEFLTLDGLKFSTSRGHAIWADELDANSDHVRVFLSYQRPSHRQSDFSLDEFRSFSARLEVQLRELHDRARRVGKQDSEVDLTILTKCNRFTKDMESFFAPTTFEPRLASRRLLSFIDETLHLQMGGRSECMMIHALALAMAPIMPLSTKSLLEALDKKNFEWITDFSRTL